MRSRSKQRATFWITFRLRTSRLEARNSESASSVWPRPYRLTPRWNRKSASSATESARAPAQGSSAQSRAAASASRAAIQRSALMAGSFTDRRTERNRGSRTTIS